jgi:type IV pilus assembly protein PilE
MKRNNGFTMVELMVVLAIVGVLAAIAYPSYTSHIIKSHRTDGMGALSSFANSMTQWYIQKNPPSYRSAAEGGADTGTPKYFPSTAPLDGGTPTYNLTIQPLPIDADPDTEYLLRATPVGIQVGDGFLEVNELGVQFWDRDNSGAIGAGENTWDP